MLLPPGARRSVGWPVKRKVHGAGGRTAVDAQYLAGDPFGLGAGQPYDGPGNVVGFATTPSGLPETAAAYSSVTGLAALSTVTKPGATRRSLPTDALRPEFAGPRPG